MMISASPALAICSRVAASGTWLPMLATSIAKSQLVIFNHVEAFFGLIAAKAFL